MEQGSTSLCSSDGNGNSILEPKHKVFLSHCGAQKGFVDQLCVDLERCDRHPFFDKRRDCLPIGKEFPRLIFEALEQCEVGVVVLSEEFFTSKWPMLELVAVANVKKRKPSFTIMPIFLGITFSQYLDVDNHKRWLSLWHTWAECDSRIDVKEWENALQLFGPTNGLKYNFELGEVKFREEIVAAICKLVPPRTKFEDSHVQGRSRLCKVIHEAIGESRVSLLYGVLIVGLYGIGGIGKTTIFKAICNELLEEYDDKVCHVELGSQSQVDIFKEVLGKLTNKNLDYLGALDVDKYRHHLMRDMMNVKVFLTIDNVSSATINQDLTLLQGNYGLGSILLVTARSMSELMPLGIDASECMEMPELEMDEAKSLFLYHATCVPHSYSSNKDDLDLISSCVRRCHFKKGDSISYHYHPLALQVLGEQLRCIGYFPTRWWLLLHEMDFLNPFGERQHPVFSILRRSFDALNPQDQLLFMDVALFAPYSGENFLPFSGGNFSFKWNVFKWLGMVHGIPVTSVVERLENLKRKSVLENFGDGLSRIDMHDLWREFARLETKSGKFEDRPWIFEQDECNVLGEASLTSSGGFDSPRRIFFFDKVFIKLKDVNLACFPYVTVLKLCTNFSSGHVVDLKGLKHLKSLELECFWNLESSEPLISIVGLGSLLELVFLRWRNIPLNSSCIDEVHCLTNFQVLDLRGCGRVPDLSKLISLQVFCFCKNDLVATILGLSSKHNNLQFLDLSSCKVLQSCWGVGELIALQELCLKGCSKLKEVPDLQKLKGLQKLDVDGCSLLQALPGLGNLVNLLELHASNCISLVKLPDVQNLKNLRILDLSFCNLIKSLPGLDELVGLQSLETKDCKNLTQLPDIHKLTNLQTLLDPYVCLQSFTGWNNLILLQHLDVGIHELYDGPNLCNHTKLERLHIFGCQARGISSLVELVLLEFVNVDNCKGVRVLPDLKRLSRLRDLRFQRCEFEDLSGLCNLISLELLHIKGCNKLEVLSDLLELAKLETMGIKGCALLRDLHGIFGLQNLKSLRVINNPSLHANLGLDNHRLTGLQELYVSECADLQWLTTCSQLQTLECRGCPIEEFPDLANFPKLCRLYMSNCVNLMNLTCSRPVCPNFIILDINKCKRLQALPDFTNSQNMNYLNVAKSGVVLSAQLIQDMKACWPNIHLITNETSSQVQSQGTSRGILRRIIGMIASFHYGCIGTSLAISHPN